MDFRPKPEHEMFRAEAARFARAEVAKHVKTMEESDRFPLEIFRKLGEMGFLGAPFPEEYGGAGADFTSFCILVEEVSRVSAAVAVNLLLHTLLGAGPIFLVGSEAQKREHLVPAIRGEKIVAAGLTEPNVGSSAADIETSARRVEGGWRINGSKMFTSNAPYCDLVTLVASTDRQKRHKGISLFIVDSHTRGVTRGPNIPRLGILGAETGSLTFDDVFVPDSALLGEEGKGFYSLMEALNLTRVALAAGCLGLAEAAFDHALTYAKSRTQFGQPIGKFQGVSFKVADKALQIHGGYGYSKEFPLERFYRDARIFEIFQGTSEINRVIIAGQLGL